MLFLLVVICQLLLIISIIPNKIIDTKLTCKYEICNIEISFPIQFRWCLIPINTYLPFTIFDGKYGISDRQENESYYFTTDIGFSIYNLLTMKNYSMFSTKQKMKDIDIGLSLGYHYKNESFSVVHNLYNSKKIDKLQFVFEFSSNEAILHFGGVPYNKQEYQKYKGILKIDETLPTWGFYLKEVVFQNVSYSINLPAIIHSASHFLFESDELAKLISKFSSIKDKEKVSFIFNNIIMQIDIDSLAKKYSQSINNSTVRTNHNYTGIIFGIEFIKLFNYSIFDFEKKQIELYSDNVIIFEYLFTKIKKLIIIINILCIINIIIILYQQISFSRNKISNQWFLIIRLN